MPEKKKKTGTGRILVAGKKPGRDGFTTTPKGYREEEKQSRNDFDAFPCKRENVDTPGERAAHTAFHRGGRIGKKVGRNRDAIVNKLLSTGEKKTTAI